MTEKTIIEGLNNKQSEAVLKTEGPLLILAGAGSGKTRVITNRIAYLINEKKVRPREILAITFTNKAAAEMRERVEAMLGLSAGSAWISTFHSMCVRILRSHANVLGYDTNFSIYDSEDSMAVCKNVCRYLEIDTKKFKEKGFLHQISNAKDRLLDVYGFESEAAGDYYLEKVAKVYRRYQKELKDSNAMDFDDLIVNTVELFKKFPEILDEYQERFRYISVDEYQDTNMAQFELVRLLADKYKNICVVGDDDQSIYKFRGANVENILSFEQSFPGAAVIRLEQNYRSTKNILDAANSVIANNRHRKTKKLWTEKNEGARIKLLYVDNPFVEADRIISLVREFVKNGGRYNDCACLYRTNAQSRNLEEAFIRENIPYKIVGGINFYQRKEIKDILAYLKVIDNDKDDVSVRRIINTPKRGIGKTTIDNVQRFAADEDISFYSALETGVTEGIFGKPGGKLEAFTELIDSFKAEKEVVFLKDLVDDVLAKSGYLADLLAENTEEAQGRIDNINELINKAVVYEETAEEPSLSGFLEEVSLIADIDSWDASDNYVSLITVHSAKGLEFPNVFLCGMEDGLFPMNAALCSGDETDLEEERRLAYVAITRAQKNLIITATRMRMVRGETMSSELSRFVREIPDSLLEMDYDNFYTSKKRSGYNRSPYGGSMYTEGLDKSRITGKDSFSKSPYGGSVYTESSDKSRITGKDSFHRSPYGGSMYTESSDESRITGKDSFSKSPYGGSLHTGNTGNGSASGRGNSNGKIPASSLKNEGARADVKKFTVKGVSLDYEIGDRVSHVKFGEGTVLDITDGGRDYEITVDFDDYGIKKIFAQFAKLKKL